MRVGKYVLQLKMNASAPSKNVQNYRIIWRCHECEDDYDEMKKECELAVGYIKEKSQNIRQVGTENVQFSLQQNIKLDVV